MPLQRRFQIWLELSTSNNLLLHGHRHRAVDDKPRWVSRRAILRLRLLILLAPWQGRLEGYYILRNNFVYYMFVLCGVSCICLVHGAYSIGFSLFMGRESLHRSDCRYQQMEGMLYVTVIVELFVQIVLDARMLVCMYVCDRRQTWNNTYVAKQYMD